MQASERRPRSRRSTIGLDADRVGTVAAGGGRTAARREHARDDADAGAAARRLVDAAAARRRPGTSDGVVRKAHGP